MTMRSISKQSTTEIIEYEFPESTKPLYPLFDGKNSIWISDPAAPKLWQFSLDTQEFTPHSFDGVVSVMLTKDNNGKIWFNDPPRNQIGFFDPDNEEITTITLPKVAPVIDMSRTTSIQADFEGNIWIIINNKDKILKYLPDLDISNKYVKNYCNNLSVYWKHVRSYDANFNGICSQFKLFQ